MSSAPDPSVQRQYALRLAADYGFAVFPVDHPQVGRYCAGVKTAEHDPDQCTERGKHPTCKWSEWATTDLERLTASHYFSGKRARNIGIHCGRSRLLVIDEDEHEEFKRFCADIDVTMPATFTVRTAKGYHYYFRVPDGFEHNTGEGAFLDYEINVRAGNGYVVAPGSVHADGIMYAAVGECRTVADAPEWLLKAVKERPGKSATGEGEGDPAERWWAEGAIRKHKRHKALVAAAGWCRRMGLKRAEAIPTMRDVHARLEGDKYTLEQALARLDDIYGRYPAGYRFADTFELTQVDPPGGTSPTGDTAEAAADTGPFVDWATFWDRDRREAEWTYPDVLARGRGHALYASHKAGKSLLMLHVAAQLATGGEPFVVCYFDYEMGEDDLYERLEEMGYGPDTDLSRLRYALLPTLPPLDTADGAAAITELLDRVQAHWPEHHLVVVFDTTARAVAGEENSADTFRAFYSHTGIELKRRGVTWARLDHAGKDATRGQRGSSSKGDDVDVVWKLARTQNGVQLRRDVARMSWVPEKVTFAITEGPLTFTAVAGDWPTGTRETVEALDGLDVPVDAATRTAAAALRAAGEGRRMEVIRAALKWRRERPTVLEEPRDPPPDPPPANGSGPTTGPTTRKSPETGPDPLRDPPGPTPAGLLGPTGSPPRGTQVAQPHPDDHERALKLVTEELGGEAVEGGAA